MLSEGSNKKVVLVLNKIGELRHKSVYVLSDAFLQVS